MTARPARLLVALAVAALAQAPAARAAEAPRPGPPAPPALQARGGRLVAAVDLSAAWPPELRKTLSNGLTNVIALHVALLPQDGEAPFALFGREIDVLYDVWEETFGVTVKDPATPRGRRLTFRTWPELQAFLASAREVDLGPAADLGGGSWVLQTRVELNPVSRELLARTRELIANPAASGRQGAPSRTLLGAMASYLLRAGDPGATVRVLRSAPFTAREVSAR